MPLFIPHIAWTRTPLFHMTVSFYVSSVTVVVNMRPKQPNLVWVPHTYPCWKIILTASNVAFRFESKSRVDEKKESRPNRPIFTGVAESRDESGLCGGWGWWWLVVVVGVSHFGCFFFLLSFIFFFFSFVVLHDRCMGAVLHVSVSLCAVAR